jgi:hypothetical protein
MMFLIVMLEPNFQLIHNSSRVRPIVQPNEVTFEDFKKALGNAITLRALNWRRNRLQTQGASKGSCITRDVARPIDYLTNATNKKGLRAFLP